MFRRDWSGLPADPIFGSNLAEIGYFVNDEDEIRSLDDPDSYFNFFLTKNERWNERQRFCFNAAIGDILRGRLENEDMKKVMLPLGTTDPSQPHVEIRVSDDLPSKKSRVIIFLGDDFQEFGVLAHRVLGGRGGVNKGSVINLIKELKKQTSSATDSASPGIIIANPGENFWWPEGKRTITFHGSTAIPMKSAVHLGYRSNEKRNTVPENRDYKEHVQYILEKVVPALVADTAKIDIIAIGKVADMVQEYLDQEYPDDDVGWSELCPRMNSLTTIAGNFDQAAVQSEGFKKFLTERAQAYVIGNGEAGSPVPLDVTAGGNVHICPTFSAGEDTVFTETILVNALGPILAGIQNISLREN
ncbi:Arb2 domain-containing protein [Rhypophila decipiens]|uniref:Arb2 domain-containing protein n=1 Tax=Rhypophila decipiens TaxID=261697 RepID=A0AAN7BAV0_9PEZI|nr:Arb2 domain-containing protein [Rhypophila decipiens]